jgi:hypothetical protein
MIGLLHGISSGQDTLTPTVIQHSGGRGPAPLDRRELPWELMAVLGLVAVGAAVTAGWINRRAGRRLPVRERAFRRMASKLGLGRDTRALVQELAAQSGVDPLALLVSPAALRAAIHRADQQQWRARSGWKQVVALSDAA